MRDGGNATIFPRRHSRRALTRRGPYRARIGEIRRARWSQNTLLINQSLGSCFLGIVLTSSANERQWRADVPPPDRWLARADAV